MTDVYKQYTYFYKKDDNRDKFFFFTYINDSSVHKKNVCSRCMNDEKEGKKEGGRENSGICG